jgi:hypothetical protein
MRYSSEMFLPDAVKFPLRATEPSLRVAALYSCSGAATFQIGA